MPSYSDPHKIWSFSTLPGRHGMKSGWIRTCLRRSKSSRRETSISTSPCTRAACGPDVAEPADTVPCHLAHKCDAPRPPHAGREVASRLRLRARAEEAPPRVPRRPLHRDVEPLVHIGRGLAVLADNERPHRRVLCECRRHRVRAPAIMRPYVGAQGVERGPALPGFLCSWLRALVDPLRSLLLLSLRCFAVPYCSCLHSLA